MQRGKLPCRANSKRLHHPVKSKENTTPGRQSEQQAGQGRWKQRRERVQADSPQRLYPYLKHHYNERTPRQRSPHLNRILTRPITRAYLAAPETIFQRLETYPTQWKFPLLPTRKFGSCGLAYDEEEKPIQPAIVMSAELL